MHVIKECCIGDELIEQMNKSRATEDGQEQRKRTIGDKQFCLKIDFIFKRNKYSPKSTLNKSSLR